MRAPGASRIGLPSMVTSGNAPAVIMPIMLPSACFFELPQPAVATTTQAAKISGSTARIGPENSGGEIEDSNPGPKDYDSSALTSWRFVGRELSALRAVGVK